MQRTIASAVSSVIKAEIALLKKHIDLLNDKLDKQDEFLKNHYKLVDQ